MDVSKYNLQGPMGFLCLDKPAGRPSRDFTTQVHKLFKPAKVGHVGTLDPMATGLLVIAIGPATRLTDRLHAFPKEYIGRFQLGVRSDTDDATGEVTPVDAAPSVTRAALEAALPQFRGTIEQIPPAFSAAKIAGRRAYDLARAGREVTLQPKTVEVHELELHDTDEGVVDSFGLRIVCGSGTYVRSLGRDLAAAVGSAAMMTSLCRTRIGPFTLEDAISPEGITADVPLTDCLRTVVKLPAWTLPVEDVPAVWNGNPVPQRDRAWPTTEEILVLRPDGSMLAIAEVQPTCVQPRLVLK